MAVSETIQEILQGIDEAQYGRDMRQYIHKGIQKCYEEGSAGETDLTARSRIDDLADNFGTVESTGTASQAYSVGDSFMYNYVLYKVTEPIAVGDTITPGTNCIAASIAEAVEANHYKIEDFPVVDDSYIQSSDSFITLYVVPSIRFAYLTGYIHVKSATPNVGTIAVKHLPNYNFILAGASNSCSMRNIAVTSDPDDGTMGCLVVSTQTTGMLAFNMTYFYGHLDANYPLSAFTKIEE